MTPTGRTRDAGWELGVRRTIPVPSDVVWAFLVGDGVTVWLGETALPERIGQSYRTSHAVTGELRGWTAGRRVRLTWRPAHWEHDSTFQVTVIPAATGSTIALHHERLADQGERDHMLVHWRAVLEALIDRLVPEVPPED
ncbi:SRPBCC domain-containing protein [Amnibacterium flavum]|uniref:Activator of Hsp90 ATPase 1 family protein n=1 Tax=Amnibacterium flavum TaxID=2173173 RepID=A0A2V1HVP1_9MICO|nr:SRPBCC domain-containing protein [Amnibacterium flavum]PVZ95159.1 activator of Hsp90 ATPase 1 family protein [Amnibacterium flavum]